MNETLKQRLINMYNQLQDKIKENANNNNQVKVTKIVKHN